MKETEISPEMKRVLQRVRELEKDNETLSNLVDKCNKALMDMTALQEMSTKQLNKVTDLMESIMEQYDQQDDQIGIMPAPDCIKK